MRVNTLSLAMTHPSNDHRYIGSVEIDRRLGQAKGTASVNYAQGRYPFKRVLLSSGVSYFDRAEVEKWLDEGARDRLGNFRITPKARP